MYFELMNAGTVVSFPLLVSEVSKLLNYSMPVVFMLGLHSNETLLAKHPVALSNHIEAVQKLGWINFSQVNARGNMNEEHSC